MGKNKHRAFLFLPMLPVLASQGHCPLRKRRDMKSVTAKFVSKAEVARRRGISRMGVYRLIARGVLPADELLRISRVEFERLENPEGVSEKNGEHVPKAT
jgi:predicted DNA-binding transcriptional regulator AlpA